MDANWHCSAMHNVLVILLHRPFVADGHLYNTSRSISVDSFMKCASAASSICTLLRAYHRAFSTRRAPYLISYATYVAATIHARIAARRGNDSTAHAHLATCLAVFQENQETNSAVNKAAMIVKGLMKKLNVVIDNVSSDVLELDMPGRTREQELHTNDPGNENLAQRDPNKGIQDHNPAMAVRPHDAPETPDLGGTGYSPNSDWVDIDGIIQSFLHENDGSNMRTPRQFTDTSPNQQPRQTWMPPQGPVPTAAMGNAFPMGPVMPAAHDVPVHGTPSAGPMYNGDPGHHGWRQFNYESAPIDDPLFGFNGSSMDNFSFMGW